MWSAKKGRRGEATRREERRGGRGGKRGGGKDEEKKEREKRARDRERDSADVWSPSEDVLRCMKEVGRVRVNGRWKEKESKPGENESQEREVAGVAVRW